MNASVLYPMPGSCTLIGRERSREQVDDVSYANESRDPQKQYAYCLCCALIGYRPCRPYVLLFLLFSFLCNFGLSGRPGLPYLIIMVPYFLSHITSSFTMFACISTWGA